MSVFSLRQLITRAGISLTRGTSLDPSGGFDGTAFSLNGFDVDEGEVDVWPKEIITGEGISLARPTFITETAIADTFDSTVTRMDETDITMDAA